MSRKKNNTSAGAVNVKNITADNIEPVRVKMEFSAYAGTPRLYPEWQNFSCAFCGMDASTSEDLVAHIKQVHPDEKARYEVIRKKYDDLRGLS